MDIESINPWEWVGAFMRKFVKAIVGRANWPITAAVFVAEWLHHSVAFFAWAWLALHVIVPIASAGFSLNKIRGEYARFLEDGGLHWKGLLALALVPGVLVALGQAYLSAIYLRRTRGHDSQPIWTYVRWPRVIAGFGASLVHHTGAFFGWMWLIAAVVGGIGQAGFGMTAIGEHAVRYFESVGEDHWQGMLVLLLIPALAIAIWRSRRAYHALHDWTQEHRHAAQATR